MASLVQLADSLHVYRGAVSVGILQDGQRALLIGFGDGDVEVCCPLDDVVDGFVGGGPFVSVVVPLYAWDCF